MKQSNGERPVWVLFRAIREQSGISQFDVARQVGITQSALSRWERSGRGLTEEVIAKIYNALESRDGTGADTGEPKFTPVGESASDGRVCARIRKTLRMKQQEIADLAGISRTSLSMFENGYLELPREDFEEVFRLLERLVEERGYEAAKGSANNGAFGRGYHVEVSQGELDHLFAAAKHEGLRKLESQMETYADPTYRLKVAEGLIERDKTAMQELEVRNSTDKKALARLEAENHDHKRHKELLGNFAAAQQLLITCQNEKILALEGNPDRDFGKGVRVGGEIDADIAEARQKVEECHSAIIIELDRKDAKRNPDGER